MQLYNTIIKYLSAWFLVSLVGLMVLVAFGFELHGQISQMKIRLHEKSLITSKLYIHIDSVNAHYLDMERNGCFQARLIKGVIDNGK